MSAKFTWPLMALLLLAACESKVDNKPVAEVKEPTPVVEEAATPGAAAQEEAMPAVAELKTLSR